MIQTETLLREWFSAADLAEMMLPAMPVGRPNIARLAASFGWDRTDQARKRAGRGGGLEYHYSLLPAAAQTAIVAKFAVATKAAPVPVDPRPDAADRGALWAWFEKQTEARRDEGRRRHSALLLIEAMVRAGATRADAVARAEQDFDAGASTIHEWTERVRGVPRGDWLAVLTPQARGGKREKIAIDNRVWDAFKADYLRLSQPSFESAYRRTKAIAEANGWTMPTSRTLRRRVDALPASMVVLARKGSEALKRMFPAQERDRSHFHALQAVNTDGHKWDVFVKWEDGTIGRPLTIAFQDLHSGKFLAWRTAKSENKDTVRLCFGDMIERFGIPDRCYLDNGRAFASKWLTGGIPNRFRFKVKPEEPVGIITQLGVEIHWTTPYAGQSKPIERGFGDFARDIAKHPAFEGAYTGNSPMAKPENYASKAVPIAEFKAVIDREIAAHNARPGRRSAVCGGTLSFDDAFNASYAQALIRKPTAEQRRMCMLAGEQVLVREKDGTIHLFGNRFFDEALWAHRGDRVTVRYDPDDLHAPLFVQSTAGVPICTAAEIEAAGFDDTEAARVHAQARGAHRKATKALLDAERVLSLADLAKLQPASANQPDVPAPAAVRPFRPTRGNLALQEEFVPDRSATITDFDELLRRGLARERAAKNGL